MTQFARPDADLDAAGWAIAPLFSKLQTYPWNGEPPTGLFIDSPNNPTGLDSQTVKFGLNNVTDPGTNRGHRLRVAWYKQGTDTIRGDVELRQGATLIATLSVASVTAVSLDMQVDTYLLTEAEASAITDYADLRIWIRPNRTAGASTSDLRVRGVELEVPSDNLPRSLPSGVATAAYAWWSARSFAQADNTDVESWQDDSGNGRSLQSRATGKPKYVAAISEANNLPGVRFDRTLATRLAVPFGGSPLTQWTTIIVHVPRSFLNSEGTSAAVLWASDSEYTNQILGTGSSSHKFAMINEAITVEACSTQNMPDYMYTQAGANHVVGGTPVLATRQVVAVKWTGQVGNSSMWVDGVKVAECTTGGDHDAYCVQLGCREPPDRFATFDAIHFLWYDRILTDQEIIDASAAFLAEAAAEPAPFAAWGIPA